MIQGFHGIDEWEKLEGNVGLLEQDRTCTHLLTKLQFHPLLQPSSILECFERPETIANRSSGKSLLLKTKGDQSPRLARFYYCIRDHANYDLARHVCEKAPDPLHKLELLDDLYIY